MTTIEASLAGIRSVFGRVLDLWDRLGDWTNAQMPKGLYARSLLIIVTPMVILQSVVAFVFMERHYNLVTRRLSAAVTQDIAAVIDIYQSYPQDKDTALLRKIANDRLNLKVEFLPSDQLPPPGPKPFFSTLDSVLSQEISRQIGKPFWIDTVGNSNLIEVRILLDKTTLQVFALRNQAYASNSHIFIVWMVATSLVLLGVAIIFLRNQIRPILRLAEAADAFGKGRDVTDYRPRGAREVRQAGLAFLEMKRRIERQIEQRTTMLAGVSHDMRTVLTRFKLELALLEDSPEVEALRRDVDELQRMLEAYLSFARRQRAADAGGRFGDARAVRGRSRAAREKGERDVRGAPHRPGAGGFLQALRRQSRRQRFPLRLRHCAVGNARAALAGGASRRQRSRHSGRQARRRVSAVPAARRRAQPEPGRQRARAFDRARHRGIARRRHPVVG